MIHRFKESNNPLVNISYVVGGFVVIYIIMCMCSSLKGKGYTKSLVKPDTRRAKSLVKPDTRHEEITSSKPMFYFSPSCPHCVNQKSIIDNASLGNSFESINCKDTPEKCKGVSGVPMFAKNDKKLVGLQTAENLQSFINS